MDTLILANAMLFLSTLSLRRATIIFRKLFHGLIISIHALLAESDERNHLFSRWIRYFYPRSPCGERPAVIKNRTAFSVFLSTLSLRRATL